MSGPREEKRPPLCCQEVTRNIHRLVLSTPKGQEVREADVRGSSSGQDVGHLELLTKVPVLVPETSRCVTWVGVTFNMALTSCAVSCSRPKGGAPKGRGRAAQGA